MTKHKATATNYDGLWGRQIKAEAERKQRMKEPTPRPWAWLPNEGQFIIDKDRNIVAEVPCTSGNPADGALIVTAVNERDQLLAEVAELRAEALKGICVYCGYIEQYESLEQKASEEGNTMRVAHIRQCEARPELKLVAFSEQLIERVDQLQQAAQAALVYLVDTGESCHTTDLIAQLRAALSSEKE